MFTKGTSGNKNGRPVNSKNKVSQDIRAKFQLLIDGNFEQIENDFKNLQPVERVRFYLDFARFVLPTLKSTEITETNNKFFEPITINLNDE
jgi:hypothetical protein